MAEMIVTNAATILNHLIKTLTQTLHALYTRDFTESKPSELPISPPSRSRVLSDLLVHLPKLVPEEQGQDGVRAEAEIRSSQAFVESHQALLPQGLREAVPESFIKLALKFNFII